MKKLPHILASNKQWAESVLREDPDFFTRLSSIQRPKYLWIGCSDSRVPANQITGLLPGEVFVHRNVGNLVGSTDFNCLSVLQYAVEVLQVEHVILCGHYGCGAVAAAYQQQKFGLIDYWLSSIRLVHDKHVEDLRRFTSPEAQKDRLCELNVFEQARNLCSTAIIQDAWHAGKNVTVHGWVYGLSDGRLRDLGFCVSSAEELSQVACARMGESTF